MIFVALNCHDVGAHDGVGRAAGAQPRDDIGVVGIQNQHVVEIPSCEQARVRRPRVVWAIPPVRAGRFPNLRIAG